MTWKDDVHLTYAIGMLPKDANWGRDVSFDDKTAILCKAGTNRPCTIWMLGKTSKTWFYDRNGPADQVSITIVPLDRQDGENARKLLANFSHPTLRMSIRFNPFHLIRNPRNTKQLPQRMAGDRSALPDGKRSVPLAKPQALFVHLTQIPMTAVDNVFL